MPQNIFSQSGGQPQKQPKWTPLFVDRTFTGLYTQRAPYHDPSDLVTSRFYGGRPDALWDGLNVELSNELTLIRRYGCSEFSTTTYPTAPDRAFRFQLSNGTVQILIDTTTAVYWDEQNGSKTLIFTKASGAGQTYFQAVGDVCYMGDGVDLLKYTPLNPNGTLWNWGLAAPTNAPTVAAVESGAAAVSWQANTMFTTMGLLNDGANIQFLVSVNQDGNTGNFGTTGQGTPNFTTAQGSITVDNTCNWTSHGQLQLWQSGHSFAADSVIFDPTSNGIYNNFGSPGTSGSGRPAFNPTFNTHTNDHGILWQYIGPPALWQPSTTYNSWWEHVQEMICWPILPTLANLTTVTQPIYIFTNNDQTTGSNNVPGTSGSNYSPQWATTAGLSTSDGDLQWVCLGSKNWAATTDYSAWSASDSDFSAVIDGNGNFQVCTTTGISQTVTPMNGWLPSTVYALNAEIAVRSVSGFVLMKVTTSGTSGSTQPTTWNFTSGATTSDNGVVWTSQGLYTAGPVWGQTYGASTSDGSTVWSNCGTAANSTWVKNTIWYLPASGFAPPQSSAPYGGADVIGSNFVQFVTASGLSGVTQPSWSVVVGNNTTDNTITWTASSAYNSSDFSLAWSDGYYYGYCYANRLSNDFWNTNTPPGLSAPLGTPTGAETGSISTMSPFNSSLANSSNTGAVNTISGLGSTDPQCDTVIIFRTADGGPSDELFWLTEIPNPKPVGGNAQPWTFQDYLPDLATTIGSITYPGLNNLIEAPQDDENDPPPAGFLPMANHFQRIWGAVQNTGYNSGGPDIVVGNPNECFNPADDWPFLSTITNMVHTPSGLITFLTSDIQIIAGGPTTLSFYSTTLVPGVGLQSYNALDIHGGEISFFSSDAQFLQVTPQLQMTRTGFPIGDKLAAFNPANVYVAVYENGVDNMIAVGDGATGYYRLNPHQVPQGEAIWSPFTAIVGGCKMIESIQLANGTRNLLIGGTGTNQNILKRDLTVFTDNGSAYESFFVMGGIVTAHPGELSVYGFLECNFAGVGSQPTVSARVGEIDPASYTAFTVFVSDPPSVYGAAGAPSSYYANRYYFAQTGTLNRGRFMFIKCDYGNTDTVKNELFDLTIYGRTFVEK
jgi:hypothetical protein